MKKFYALCLQGDIKSAMEYLSSIHPRTEEINDLLQLYQDRFFSANFMNCVPIDDQWVKSVIGSYYQYFQKVLTDFKSVEKAEIDLSQQLAHILGEKQFTNIEEIEQQLARVFTEKGFYFLGGVTPPFRGPYIWREMETLTFDVEIPSSIKSVTVQMMSDFILESWIGFATFNKKTVGGWAKAEGLYCNAKCYENLKGEEFQISYLKHEAQHLYDYEHFPLLTSSELEYRAKLVELVYKKDHSTLFEFIDVAKNDPDFPHPYAAYQIINHLSKTIFDKKYEPNKMVWSEIKYPEISSAARALLEKNTEIIQKSV